MPGKGLAPSVLWPIAFDTCLQSRRAHNSSDLFVMQSVRSDIAIALPDPSKDGTILDLGECEPNLQRLNRASLRLGPTRNLDSSPASLASNSEKDAFTRNLDPTTAILSLLRTTVEPDNLGASEAARKADQENGPIA